MGGRGEEGEERMWEGEVREGRGEWWGKGGRGLEKGRVGERVKEG